MNTMKFGFRYFKKHLFGAIVVEILGFIAIAAEMMLPMLSALLIDYCILGTAVEETSGGIFHFLLTGKYGAVQTFDLFWSIAALFMVFVFLRVVLVYIRNLYQVHIGLVMETDLRIATFHKLNELDSASISRYNTGELLQTLNGDTIMFKEMFSRVLPFFFDSIFILITSIGMLALQDIRFIVIPLILTPFLAYSLLRFRSLAKKNFQKIRSMSSAMNMAVTENIEAVRIVRSFTNEDLEKEKFGALNEEFKQAHLNQIYLQSKFDLLFNGIKQLAYVSTIAIAAYMAINGQMQVGFIAASASYVMKVMGGVTNLNNQLFQMTQQVVGGERIRQFMECESHIEDKKDSKLYTTTPSFEFKHASLRIDDTQILEDVNISIPYGKKLGIVGPTGGGKSVLIKTLIRMMDLTDGEILVNGRSIKDYSLYHLRKMFSLVFQDVFLFSNTIDSNIAYGQPGAEEMDVILAAKKAQADRFIRSLSEGYQTVVGERGLGISGGQKQRVSIARAFLKNAPVLVLDDSTSALDVNTERTLLQVVRENYSEKTVIITAHRLSSVVACDEILYIQDGKIAERGTFDELMQKDGLFASVYHQQQTQEASVNFDALAEHEQIARAEENAQNAAPVERGDVQNAAPAEGGDPQEGRR
ncbi:MAG: ABC transporter ATP-binding protein/permease [Lachnospiraceae bacterium]|nr:ABC transporter ATP-binding protein/permease [Lachnospiraceae bacterium]